ncbi:Transcription factor SFL1 [Ceratocystis lukuohia]|uniref:Transcription factor SFL1 n=1 Tax=Ceratocystis lukuohia TaxID=2019550 RepID=A0ABR4MFG6_9PEZI
MATVTENPHRFNMAIPEGRDDHSSRVVPIPTPTIRMSAPPPGDPMDISTSPARSAPRNGSLAPILKIDEAPNDNVRNGGSPMDGVSSTNNQSQSSANNTSNGNTNNNSNNGTTSSNNSASANGNGNSSSSNPSNSNMPAPPNAGAAAHQPKIVQTAFIHKLYNMLEDNSIQHLISWSSSADSFVMSPSADFSKVLSQYFKHTNISSFVRQLNMYGFHKVSDVFHTSNPESALWEFKHGGGNFKRGDLVGLREIKRRASRHALVHRELGTQKNPLPPPPGMSEPMPMPDMTDPRVLDHALYDLNMRLQRSEEISHFMQMRQQALTDSMVRMLQFSQEMARAVSTMVPPENPVHREVLGLQGEMARQMEALRPVEEAVQLHPPPHDPYVRGPYYENGPISPHHPPQDDPRRATLVVPPQQPPVPRSGPYYRPAVPSNLSINSNRRPYGSIGGSPQTSPNSRHPAPPPPPPPPPHPLSNVEGLGVGRRHTTADIRAHGWQPNVPPQYPPHAGAPAAPAPTSSHQSSSHQQQQAGPPQWPPSPNRPTHDEQKIRDSLSSFSMQGFNSSSAPRSRPATPPPSASFPSGNGSSNNGGNPSQNGVMFSEPSWGGPDNKNLNVRESSVPPTRRGSMAHILNPTMESSERDDDDLRGDDDRKRKRIQ